MRLVNRFVPSTDKHDGQKLFTRKFSPTGRLLATPLFAVLILIEFTDVIFAVDSVPAVLAVSHEPFIVFSSNAFAILGLRALYFLLADLHARFRYLQTGLAVILAFVGAKMIVQQAFDFHIETYVSLAVIGLILAVSIGASLLWGDSGPGGHDDSGSADAAGGPCARCRRRPGLARRGRSGDGDQRRRHRTGEGGGVARRRRQRDRAAAQGRRQLRRAVPVPRREDAVVQRARADRPLLLLRLRPVGRRHHVRRADPPARLRRRRRVPRRQSRHPTDLHDVEPVGGAAAAQAADRRDGDGGRVVPPPVARGPGRPAGTRLPAQPRPVGRRRQGVPPRLGAGRVGCAGAPLGHRQRAVARHRVGLRQSHGADAGRLSGADPVPDLRRQRRRRRRRRAGAAGLERPGEVQELAGDADLLEVARRCTDSTGRRPTSPTTTRSSCARATPT